MERGDYTVKRDRSGFINLFFIPRGYLPIELPHTYGMLKFPIPWEHRTIRLNSSTDICQAVNSQ